MPIHLSWDDEPKSILRYDYDGKWAWSELYAISSEVNTMMTSVSHPVSIIHNLTKSSGLPSGALTHAQLFTRALPDNWEISVVAGSGAFTEALLTVFSRVYKKLGERYRTAPTLEEARAVIVRTRQKAGSSD